MNTIADDTLGTRFAKVFVMSSLGCEADHSDYAELCNEFIQAALTSQQADGDLAEALLVSTDNTSFLLEINNLAKFSSQGLQLLLLCANQLS